MDAMLVWSSDECAPITAVRPSVVAPAFSSAPPCASVTPRGFGPCCDRGSLRASPDDALLNFSFLKRQSSGYLGTAQQHQSVRSATKLPTDEARQCSSAGGPACAFNPTIERAMALLGPAPRAGTFVDVGANGGRETRLALASGMNVLAVECLPEAHRELLAIFHGVPAARLRLLHACASNSTGVATLHRAGDSSSMVPNNVRRGVEAFKAEKERTKESQVNLVVLDSELLPRGRPDSASLRGDVRLVKIDTQVAPHHEPSLQETPIAHSHSTCHFSPHPTDTLFSLDRVAQGNELLVLSGLRRTLRTWRPLIFFENNQMDTASLAAVEAMLSTAPLSYICTRGFQDSLCIHAERRQKRIEKH